MLFFYIVIYAYYSFNYTKIRNGPTVYIANKYVINSYVNKIKIIHGISFCKVRYRGNNIMNKPNSLNDLFSRPILIKRMIFI